LLSAARKATQMSTFRNTRSVIGTATLFLGLAWVPLCHAACTPDNLATPAPKDPVARVLAAEDRCPKSTIEFVDALKRSGARLEPTMVNFTGFHNPGSGAFFIFEIVSSDGGSSSNLAIERGDLLFGHFTGVAANDRLVSNHTSWSTAAGSTAATPRTSWTTCNRCIASGLRPHARSAGGCVAPDATSTAVSSKKSSRLLTMTGSSAIGSCRSGP
jgi:hypothetical protein